MRESELKDKKRKSIEENNQRGGKQGIKQNEERLGENQESIEGINGKEKIKLKERG